MDIFSRNFAPPSQFVAHDFVLFMTDVRYALPDHEAVMKSRESLRIYSQSEWPEDDFTVEQNREDLQRHVDDNNNHEAYGYMIFSPDRRVCYGSLYVNPLTRVSEHYALTPELKTKLEQHDARIDFWLVEGIDEKPAENVLAGVRGWFKREWKIRPLFSARREMTGRRDLYQKAGLKLQADLQGNESHVNLLLFS